MIPKLNKYNLNKYFKELEKENVEYTLLLKVAYIYGKNIEEVIQIKKEHIQQNTITIKQKQQILKYTYPISNEFKKELQENITPNKEGYLFTLHNHPQPSTIINEFLKKVNRKINKKYFIKIPHITSRDFKRLRGQHLILDGATINLVRHLYGNTNTRITRKFLQIDELLQEAGRPTTIEDIIENNTDLNIYQDKEFIGEHQLYHIRGPTYPDNNPQRYHNNIEINPQNNQINIQNPDTIIDQILTEKTIKELNRLKIGEYKIYNNLIFTRTL